MTHHPVHVSHSYTQHLDAPPHVVFPLLCPVRERDWVPGWDPAWVVSHSGLAEEDCVFATDDEHGRSTWIITDHDPVDYRIRMYKVTPDFVVTRLDIALFPLRDNATTADVRYGFTALSPEGEAFVASRTSDWYLRFMEAWERGLNAHLHGT